MGKYPRPGIVFLKSFAFFFLSGCSSVALPIAIPILVSGAGGGIAYTVTNVAYKTFSYPIGDVEAATHRALEKMRIEELERKGSGDGVRIRAKTKRLKIYIDLEVVTTRTTRIEVNAKKMGFLKDKATATEIITQTERFLEGKN